MHERGGTLRFRASRWAACECCTGHALCSAMLLPYLTLLGAIGTSGALIVLLTGDLAAVAAGRRWLSPAHDHSVAGSTSRRRSSESPPHLQRVPRIGEVIGNRLRARLAGTAGTGVCSAWIVIVEGSLPYAASAWLGGQPAALWLDR